MKVRSKICGIKHPDNLRSIAALQPDYMGFIFYPLSARFMGDTLQPSDLAVIPDPIIKTGVFVNEESANILEIVQLYGLDAVQLHGDESPVRVDRVRGLMPAGVSIIKAFGVSGSFDWKTLNDYQDCCDIFLFDTKTTNYGGSGRKFDHDLLNSYRLNTPVMISGGIGVEDLPDVLVQYGRELWGVDMNSRLEVEPGRKDLELVERALEIIENYER